MAGRARCSMKSLQWRHAMCARGTTSLPHEANHIMSHSIYTMFLPATPFRVATVQWGGGPCQWRSAGRAGSAWMPCTLCG